MHERGRSVLTCDGWILIENKLLHHRTLRTPAQCIAHPVHLLYDDFDEIISHVQRPLHFPLSPALVSPAPGSVNSSELRRGIDDPYTNVHLAEVYFEGAL